MLLQGAKLLTCIRRASSDLGLFYVLYSGRAFKSEGHFDIINGQKVTGYLEAGEVFGENESLSYGNAREHSVTCSVDCLVLACPRELYHKVPPSLPPSFPPLTSF